MALDNEFPMLEYPYIVAPTRLNTALTLPDSLRASHLRYLIQMNFALPIRSPLFTSTIGLVTLSLGSKYSGAFFRGEANAAYMPIMTRVIGASAYLEATLKSFAIEFFNLLTFSLRPLIQFWEAIHTAENTRFGRATFTFRKDVVVMVMRVHNRIFSAQVGCTGRHLDRQLESATQIFGAVRTLFSTVEVLALEYTRDCISSESHNEAYRGQWRELLKLFSNAKTLLVHSELICQFSFSLRLDNGEWPHGAVTGAGEPRLYAPRGVNDAFTAFMNARLNTSRPVTLCFHPRTRLFSADSSVELWAVESTKAVVFHLSFGPFLAMTVIADL